MFKRFLQRKYSSLKKFSHTKIAKIVAFSNVDYCKKKWNISIAYANIFNFMYYIASILSHASIYTQCVDVYPCLMHEQEISVCIVLVVYMHFNAIMVKKEKRRESFRSMFFPWFCPFSEPHADIFDVVDHRPIFLFFSVPSTTLSLILSVSIFRSHLVFRPFMHIRRYGSWIRAAFLSHTYAYMCVHTHARERMRRRECSVVSNLNMHASPVIAR